MKKLSIGYCISVISLFMLIIFLRVITQQFLVKKLHIENAFTKTLCFDIPRFNVSSKIIPWETLYPFSTNTIDSKPAVDRFKSKIITVEEMIKRQTRDNLLYRALLVELAAWYENLIGWELDAEIIDLGNGYFTSPVTKVAVVPDSEHSYTPGTTVCEFNGFLTNLGIDFLYIQLPHKIGKNDTVVGISDFSNKNADELLQMLSAKNIPYLDIRQSIYQEHIDHHSLFFRTDHHWKPETGLWAAGIIGKYLNEHKGFAIDTDIFLPDRYSYDVYERFFLGSQGRKVTLVRAAPDDFSLLYPLFDTDVSLQIPSKAINARGSFDIFYWHEQMRQYQPERIGYYNLSRYDTYMYSDNPVTIIQNNLIHNGKKVCFIIDSFGLTLIPFLALGLERIDVLDIRSSANGFSGSVRRFIEQNKPDMVVVMYNPNAIAFPPLDYTNHDSAFDFR
jgi:hypothetical protein